MIDPGEYWLDHSEGRSRALVTFGNDLIVEQRGGGWSNLTDWPREFWSLEPRRPGDDWHEFDETLLKWEREKANQVDRLARELLSLMHKPPAEAARQLLNKYPGLGDLLDD